VTALFLLYVGGAVDTAVGSRLAKRLDRVTVGALAGGVRARAAVE
jgi:hypothetical protein